MKKHPNRFRNKKMHSGCSRSLLLWLGLVCVYCLVSFKNNSRRLEMAHEFSILPEIQIVDQEPAETGDIIHGCARFSTRYEKHHILPWLLYHKHIGLAHFHLYFDSVSSDLNDPLQRQVYDAIDSLPYTTIYDTGGTYAVISVSPDIDTPTLKATLRQAAYNLFSPGRSAQLGDDQAGKLAQPLLEDMTKTDNPYRLQALSTSFSSIGAPLGDDQAGKLAVHRFPSTGGCLELLPDRFLKHFWFPGFALLAPCQPLGNAIVFCCNTGNSSCRVCFRRTHRHERNDQPGNP